MYHAFNPHFEGSPQSTADLLLVPPKRHNPAIKLAMSHWSSFSRWGSGWKTLGRPNLYDSGKKVADFGPKKHRLGKNQNMRPWWYQDRDLNLSIRVAKNLSDFTVKHQFDCQIGPFVWGAKPLNLVYGQGIPRDISTCQDLWNIMHSVHPLMLSKALFPLIPLRMIG